MGAFVDGVGGAIGGDRFMCMETAIVAGSARAHYPKPRPVARHVACVTILVLLLGGCGTAFSPKGPGIATGYTTGAHPYQATIRRTQFGVVHVTADNWEGLGFGHGYAAAEDNLCVLADAFLTFRGQRSRYFGPDARLPPGSTLPAVANLDSDFFFRHLASDEVVAKFYEAQPVELRAMSSGYAAGYSRYVTEIRAGEHTGRHESCRNSAWLSEIRADDLYRRMFALNIVLGSAQFIGPIANAQPPTGAVRATSHGEPIAALRTPLPGDIGSNVIGFGSEATGRNQGLLLGNPHWFWGGVDRFEQVHLKIPNQIDVEGAAILGVPVVVIGFNHDVAWSHTVSTARRFTLYRLKLVAGDPTAYLYDGQIRHLRASPVTVDVRDADGTVRSVTRLLYDSHFGPVLAHPWNQQEAISLRDVNVANFRAFRNWLRWNRARSLDEFMQIQREEVAIPWVNTVAIGRNDGRVWYADIGAIPGVDDHKLADCKVGEQTGRAWTLDGSRSACEWQSAPDMPQAGILPPSQLPQVTRKDYVANMNDSYWLTNPAAPLTGFAKIIGDEGSPQSLRTRLGHLLVRERLTGADHQPGNGLDSESVRRFSLNSRSLSAELFLDDVLRDLCPRSALTLAGDAGATVDIREACRALAAWDRRGNPDSRGAHVWDSCWEQLESVPDAELYETAFDPARPIDTPRGLNTVNPKVAEAFAAGVLAVQGGSVPLDAPRSQYQFLTTDSGKSLALAGGCANSGYFTVVCATVSREGIALTAHGNSYLQVVSFTDQGGVEPFTLLLPSQSSDPASPHYRDYTAAYARKEWLRAPFTDEEVAASTLESLRVEVPVRKSLQTPAH